MLLYMSNKICFICVQIAAKFEHIIEQILQQ